jgi:hypothetical protein
MREKKRMGRPPKKPAQRRSQKLTISLRPSELAALRQRAEAARISIADYVRGEVFRGG